MRNGLGEEALEFLADVYLRLADLYEELEEYDDGC